MMARRIPEPRRAVLAKIRDPVSLEEIDSGLALWFPGPRSETGEDMAELQLHGGRAVVAATLSSLGRLEGFRPAEPGEFTRRAFENGRLDLTEVEGLADLIAAETEAQRRQAHRQLTGWLSGRAETWRGRLVQALAQVEARIDFVDEADVPEDLIGPALEIVRGLRDEIASALADGGRGERVRDGLVIAIAGPPNAGKSSLLNRIAQREAAIVTPFAGTTRDAIEVHLDLAGYPVTIVDTAGIRDTDDPVEQEGIRRARARAAGADLVLWVVDATAPSEGPREGTKGVWIVRNKIDLFDSGVQRSPAADPATFLVSAMTGDGLDQLIRAVVDYVGANWGPGDVLITRERHRLALRQTGDALSRALEQAVREDLLAEELRLAARALGKLTGRVDVEDVLDVIFREFCIGK
jgi:tRNA modification GTPase